MVYELQLKVLVLDQLGDINKNNFDIATLNVR